MSAIRTAENKSHDLGTAAKRFKDLYVGGIDADSDVSITGTLTVDGAVVSGVDNTDLSSVATPSTTVAPSQEATKNYVDSQVAAVIDAAPDALNTLNELAAALNDDANIGSSVTANTTKLAGIESGATADQTGAEIKSLYEAEADTNAFTDAEKTKLAGLQNLSDLDGATIKQRYEAENDTNAFTDSLKSKLELVEAGATADQTGAEIKALYEAEDNAFTDTLYTKLSAIEAGATADQTGAEIKSLYEAEADTNAFSDSLKAKLEGIEASATADQTGAEIKALYESEADTNAFSDSLKAKLEGIEASATADQTGSEIKALYEAEDNAFTDALYTKLTGIEAGATADQTKADIDALGVDAATVNSFSVGVSVPANAVFTDTTYSVQDGELSQNNFTDALKSKLDGIEAGATADQTKADIDSLGVDAATVNSFSVGVSVPANAVFTDTTYSVQDGELSQNNFTDALKSKLDNIEASADVTDATNVANAGAVMQSDSDASSFSFVLDEANLGSNSSTKVPTQGSVKSYVDSAVSSLVDSSPDALNTLNELAAALGDDPSFATTVTNSIATKAAASTQVIAGSGLSGGGSLSQDRTLAVADLNLSHFSASSVTTSSEDFSDSDSTILTAAAVADKIESYGYTTASSLGLDDYMPVAGGTFTGAVEVQGNLTIKGDLIQFENASNGTSESVSFADANIVVDADNPGSAVADGAGLTLEGGSGDDVTFQWNATDGRMELKEGTSFASLKVDSLISTSGTVEVTATSAQKLDHNVTFSISGDVSTSASVTTDFASGSGSTIELNTSIADGSLNPSVLETSVPISKGGTGAVSAPAARTALGVDPAGTDNSTDVTLASVSANYLSISGQEITAGVVPLTLGGTGATTAAAARTALEVDVAGTDNSTDVTLASVSANYLSISGQEITAGVVPLNLGGTGATTAAAARTALEVDVAGTDNSTDVTLSNTNYLTINGQEITAGTVPLSSGGTGATTAAAARTALEVDVAGTDNSTDVTLSSVTSNYLTLDGQEITAGIVPLTLGGTGATTAAAARTVLEVDPAGTDNSTDVTLASVTDNFLSLSGQEISVSTVPVSLGGTGATSAEAARAALEVDVAGTDNSTDVTLASVSSNYLSISGQEITAGNVPLSLGGTGATTAEGARTALEVDPAGTDNSTDVTLATVHENYLSISGQEITVGTVPVSLGGTGATTASAARTALEVDKAGTDNSTDVTLSSVTDNYLSISGQEITASTVPLSLGGTGATTAAEAREALDVDQAGTDNSTDVTLSSVTDNYLSISGQEITASTVPLSLGGTGATTAAEAREALDVDQAGTDNSTDVTLAAVTDNYLSISGQEVTAGTVPVSLGGTGATTASAARLSLGVAAASDFAQGSAWKSVASGSDTLVTMSNEIDGHSGSWKVINRLETTQSGGNITAVSLVADFQVRPSSRITKIGSLPDTLWNIPSDGVLQLR